MHPTVELLAAYAWRLLVIAAAAVGVIWLLGEIWVVFTALVIGLFLTRALTPVADVLRQRMPNAPASVITLVGFLAVVAAAVWLIGSAVVNEVDDVGRTVSAAIDDLEDWVVDDSPVDVSRADIQGFRDSLGERFTDAARDSSGKIVSGAVVAVELVLSLFLGLVITFFMLKDGSRFVRWAMRRFPDDRVGAVSRMGSRAWRTLGGYLRGAAVLGVIEGLIIGVTIWLVGGDLAIPMGVVTFIAAFVPFAGAVVAGALSVLVVLATAGPIEALIVLAVAVAVQQFDNDLLAPVVYGRALEIHPVTVLVAITAGGALFGLAGGFLAVPVTAVVMNVIAEARAEPEEERASAAEDE